MRIIGPRPQVTVVPTVKSARPPDDYLKLLTQDEQEFRDYVRQVETQPVFQRLVEDGHVRKRQFKGRIPRHQYEEFQDRQFMEFLKEFEIEQHRDWQSDFFREDARRHVKELATQYDVPRGRLIHALEYCRYLKRAWAGHEDYQGHTLSLDDPEFREPPVSQASFESEESYEQLATLMEQYEITSSEFIQYFMVDDPEPACISDELGIPQNVVRDICEHVDQVQTASSTMVTVVDTPSKPLSTQAPETVATVCRLSNPPRAEIHVASDVELYSRYQIQITDENIDEDTSRLVNLLRLINQRKSLGFRVLMFIYEYQYRYLVSGDELHLKPLTQADISKELGEHESTVSRVLRHRYIDTPDGAFSLKFFCQSKGDVIRRLIAIRERQELESEARQKPYSDAELSDILEREYNTKIARRTVTYYRNKFGETPKFYTRQRVSAQTTEG
jgi:predicted CopG family antitoxin